MPPRELEVSTSPRATWVWAADVDEAEQLRGILTEAGCSPSDATGANAELRVLDLDIGVVALDALRALGRAGYTFRWHSGQSPLNRLPALYGVGVADPVS
jgi:hypothetical protein